ncbi:MAG TPA: hemolysin family protein, partial [Candidatus Thermoplasmatota archaeon]|nr:hemolysin family protein [Candidatus Thermoplasmatota archaeon]
MAAAPLGEILFYLALVLFLVFLNGFFVAAEFAIVKIRATQIEESLKAGNRRAKRAKHVVNHLDAYLSATQLGITLASLGLGWIGEPAIAHLIVEPLLAYAGVTSETVITTVSFAIAFAVITFLHIILGELAPKSLAIQKPMGTTLAIAAPLHMFFVIFKPAIWVLNGTANRLLRLIGVQPASEAELVHSEEEVRIILSEAGRPDDSGDQERTNLALRVMDLKDTTVGSIMTPRSRLAVLDLKDSWAETMRKARAQGFSRFPVVDGGLDNVVGMVLFRDLVTASEDKSAPNLRALLREMPFVPESQRAEDLLWELVRRGRHMAVVVDEFGSSSGLVTLEDIFEEIVGEIRDEYDEGEQRAYRKVADGHYFMMGEIPLREVEQLLDVELP